MVQAILEGRKTQTRRIVKPQPDFDRAWKNLGMTEKFGLETELEIPELDLTGYFLGVSSPIGDGKIYNYATNEYEEIVIPNEISERLNNYLKGFLVNCI